MIFLIVEYHLQVVDAYGSSTLRKTEDYGFWIPLNITYFILI